MGIFANIGILTEPDNFMHPANALIPNSIKKLRVGIDYNDLQPENALGPISETLFISICCKKLQYWNAHDSITLNWGPLTDYKAQQFWNAALFIVVAFCKKIVDKS